MIINKDGYPEIEVYGLKIRASEDKRIEIDVKNLGLSVNRIYIEFDFDEGYALIRTHNGEINQKMPFHQESFNKYLSAIGKKGGESTSDKKRKSSVANLAKARLDGKKGGRPKK